MHRHRLYASDLEALDACPEQVYLFARTFPKGTTPTLANARKARTAGLDLLWLAIALTIGSPLQDAYYATINSASGAYNAAINSAEDAYSATINSASDAYNAAINSAEDAYSATVKSARDAYYATIKPARDAYDAATKPARDAYDATVDEITVDLLVTIWP